MKEILKFQDSVHGLLNWFLDYRSLTLDAEGEHRPAAIAEHIASCYRILPTERESIATVVKHGTPIRMEEYLAEDTHYRKPIGELYNTVNQQMQDFVSHFFLHGSMATLDYVHGWSDVDTFVVLKKETVCSPSKLVAFRRLCMETWPLLLKITPLQHHGLIIAAEQDLVSYSSHYMPLPVFDHALCLLDGQPPLEVHLRSNDTGALNGLLGRRRVLSEAMDTGVFKHHPRDGRYLMAFYRNADDAMFQLFCFLNYIMNVPAYFLDGCGRACYKRESFELARPHFSDAGWRIIDRASRIRELWAEKEGLAYSGNAIPKWLQDVLGRDYIADALVAIDEAIDKIGRERSTATLSR